MLFRRQHTSRLNPAEIEAVRNRARGFISGMGERDFTLTDLFTLAFSGEGVPGSNQRHPSQDEGTGFAHTESAAISTGEKTNSRPRSAAQKKRQPGHNKAAKYAGSEIRV